ncbi:MAG: hypothetical protein KGZ68_15140 [Dechloromonas sp.]|nr:hypothetical protein [Dechloromonas sp.]
MKITRDPPSFRPVTIRLESEDEVDKLVAIVAGVARNVLVHTSPVIAAAKDFEARFCRLLNEDN